VWFDDAVGEQLKVLLYAALIRPANKGYILTEKGRQDRQQVARFNLNNNPPPEAA
jgi:predicted transcriptional regulator